MDRIKRDTLLGLVFFGTLGFLLWATVNLTDISLRKQLEVFFADAGGAQVGTNVMVLGKKIGKVGAIDYLPSEPAERIRMQLLLQEDVVLRADARIEVQDAGVLGGKQIYIDPGTAAAPWGQGRLVGLARKGAFEQIGGIAEGEGKVGVKLDDALKEIRDFFRNLNDPETSIGALVRRRELYDEVLQTVQSLHAIFRAVEEGEGLLGRVVKDRTLREDGMRLVANLAAVSDTLRTTDGTLGVLLNDRDTAARLQQIVADLGTIVGDARDGKGPLGKILRDEAMAQDLGSAMQNLNRLLQKLNDPGAGALGALTSDPDIAQDLRVVAANLRVVSDRLTQSKGALGVLINDEDTGTRLKRIFTQVSRALEDAREAAPIGSFVQVLLGAF